MSGDSFGKLFKVTNWGESHGKAIGIIIEGCPPLLNITEKEIQKELNRRTPGQSKITTQRKEPDKVEIISGVFNGKTTGTPISMIIHNTDFKKEDYKEIKRALSIEQEASASIKVKADFEEQAKQYFDIIAEHHVEEPSTTWFPIYVMKKK